MDLNAREAAPVEQFRRPPQGADEVADLVRRLAAWPVDTRIDWSDSWSDEDLERFRARSLERLEAEEQC